MRGRKTSLVVRLSEAHRRSLSQWDCQELARQLVHDNVVTSISPETVRRILENHQLKPWRHHLWLSAQSAARRRLCRRRQRNL